MTETVWVCPACGKSGPTRGTVGDESCRMWAVECWPSSLVFDGWRVTAAVAVTEPWVEPLLPPPPKGGQPREEKGLRRP